MVASLSKIQKYLSKFLFEPQQKQEFVKLSWNCFQNVNNEVSARYSFFIFPPFIWRGKRRIYSKILSIDQQKLILGEKKRESDWIAWKKNLFQEFSKQRETSKFHKWA